MTVAGRHALEAAAADGRQPPSRRRLAAVLALGAMGVCGAFRVHAAAAQEAILQGQVVSVHDGDTITVLDAAREQHKVRLSGIDAPESGQAWGERSRQALADALFRRQVVVRWTKRDRYGRIVGKVLQDDRDVCLSQVSAGLAWHYAKYEREQPADDRAVYRQAQDEARAAGRGLWRDPSPVAPWDFRRERSR